MLRSRQGTFVIQAFTPLKGFGEVVKLLPAPAARKKGSSQRRSQNQKTVDGVLKQVKTDANLLLFSALIVFLGLIAFNLTVSIGLASCSPGPFLSDKVGRGGRL